jgi:dihydrofolate synthase/folylpolyglutamate synthase
MANLESTLNELYSFLDFEKKNGKRTYDTTYFDLERFRKGLASRGNPQNKFPSVLIAGSKGKGSTSAFLESILRQAGYRTGLFTSPHLVKINERIRIAGKCVGDDALAQKLDELIAIAKDNDSEHVFRTVFEILTGAAFEIFAENKVEIAVVEVGLGGRLDATNILEPVLTAITTICLEHTDILGDTYSKIASEKAGILRKGIPLIIGKQPDEAETTIRKMASDIGSHPVFGLGKEFRIIGSDYDISGCRFSIASNDWSFDDLRIPLLGNFQIENAAVAVALAIELKNTDLKISEEAIRKGLDKTVWLGRLQVIPGAPTLVLDGAHSPEAVGKLVESVSKLWKGAKPVYIFGSSNDKNFREMLKIIVGNSSAIIVTDFENPRAAKTVELKNVFDELELSDKTKFKLAANPTKALLIAKNISAENSPVIITGSLYLIGEFLKLLKIETC